MYGTADHARWHHARFPERAGQAPEERRRFAVEACRPHPVDAGPPSPDQALAALRRAFPAAVLVHDWRPLADGTWACTITQEGRAARP